MFTDRITAGPPEQIYRLSGCFKTCKIRSGGPAVILSKPFFLSPTQHGHFGQKFIGKQRVHVYLLNQFAVVVCEQVIADEPVGKR